MANWDNSSPMLTNCTFNGNAASWGGAGVLIRSDSIPVLVNCTFSGNAAGPFGGGLYIRDSATPVLTNCTFSGNSATSEGGGIFVEDDSTLVLANCVLWGNTAPTDPQISVWSSGYPTVAYSCVQGGYVGEGNIDADPLLIDADGPDDVYGTDDDDLHLSPGSPCIDAGCNCAVPEDFADLDGDGVLWEYVPFDLDGEGRFFDDPDTPDSGSGLPPIVDMGAYEFGGSDLPPCHGDLDGDRDVDLEDLAVLLAHYGMSEGANGADGDMDCDGDIELSDLADFLGAYGDLCE